MIARKVAELVKIVRCARIIPFCCLLFAFLCIIWWLFHEVYVIRCINSTLHTVFYSKKIKQGECFTLKYIHSVQKTPVYEIFSIDNKGRIILLETRVMSLGYGLPAPTQKDNYTMENGFLVIKNMNKKIGKILIRVNFVRLMELQFGQKTLDLRQYGRTGDLIEVSAALEKKINTLIGISRKEL